MTVISISIDDDILTKLDDYAEEIDRNRSDAIRQILKEKLN